jgi:Mg-chelatase subunit ChlD
MKRNRKSDYGGSSLILTIGAVLIGLSASALAIDTSFYFSAQNQLQTATDAAALAGGAHMFEGADAAEAAALELAEANSTGGMALSAENFQFETGAGSFSVRAQKQVPTIMANLMCSLAGKIGGGGDVGGEGADPSQDNPNNNDSPPAATDGCSYMTVYAASKAVGAPRDTVLVLDTSSSMDDLGYGQPFKDVKSAAKVFLDMVVEMEADSPDSVDKVAIVKFDRTSTLVKPFTSTHDSPNLNSLRNSIDTMKLYSGSGWNTNYEAGLKVGLDHMAAYGRQNSHKTIIFFTDGEPNLPEGSTAITTCLSYQSKKKYSQMKTCAQNYVNYMISKTNTQIQRAKNMEVTIHTIQINDAEDGNSLDTFQSLLQNSNWKPGLLDKMASETEGEQYEASNADTQAIMEIFRNVAKIVNIKLGPASSS